MGKLWECGKSGNTGGVGRWISFLRIGFFTIVEPVIQRAILYATVKSLYFKTTHDKALGVYSKHFMGCSSVLHMGLCNWQSIILIFMSVIIAVLLRIN